MRSDGTGYCAQFRFDTLLNRIGSLVADDEDELTDGSSPQYDAMDWLVNDDPAELDFDATSTSILIERYALAVLYFALDGDSWDSSYGFLSEDDVCDWNGPGSDFTQGVLCSGGSIYELTLGSCSLF